VWAPSGDLKSLDHAVALAAVLCANRFPIKAIAALTESGTTTRLMSREQSRIPIFALSRHADTLRRVSLYRGVHAIPFDITRYKPEQVTKAVLDLLVKLGVVEDGDDVLITKGDVHGSMGGTNGMKVVRVGGANDEA
jgi:pyruvate kinase